ncbi:hypothetical protein LF1_18270 [Rubripirellula obstinata]|uniref:G domain-containing protein n=1 Tax=Rubripirellula obstinata TaxID=406547 RepID=A0A5B1CDR5_9BACT|nr:GTPase [Rubripirellula obstinata]KAA1259297.1 hypothetical protein LF1_18270 [Rubripirellula obstinata]
MWSTSHSQSIDLPDAVPVAKIWMLGKTGSGKSSIIHFITGADDAEIGSGFRPQTKHSREYGFPDDKTPLVRFLDTRGLGEAGYDASDDLKAFGKEANLVIITVRATDQATESLIAPLQKIRKENPDRPVLLVITAIHDACPGQTEFPADMLDHWNRSKLPEGLRRVLQEQLRRFDGLYDSAVVIDLTKPEDGFHPPDLGGERLFEAIMNAVPAAMRSTLGTMRMLQPELHSSSETDVTSVDTLILTHATLAAGAAAVPIAWIDMPVVLGIQTHLAHRIAKHHGQTLNPTAMAQLSVVLGGRAAIRMAVRGFSKLIPVVGSAINSAAAFALVFASGKVLDWYFAQVQTGRTPSQEEVSEMYSNQLDAARAYWKKKQLSESDLGAGDSGTSDNHADGENR